MATYVVKAENLGATLQANARAVRGAISKGITRAAYRGKAHLIEESGRKKKVDLGQFRASWKVVRGKGDQGGDEIINDAPHAGIIELGARPHPVSQEGWNAIFEWVKRHREYFGFKKPKRPRFSKKRDNLGKFLAHIALLSMIEEELKSITWAIVGKIKREGQQGTYIVRDSIPVLSRHLTEEVERLLKEVAQRPPRGRR